jgi:ferrous iron transport protein A
LGLLVEAEQKQAGTRMALSELAEGEWGVIEGLDLPPEILNQLAHMGFMPGAPVQALRHAPAGDPTVYSIDSSEVALRRETARHILVTSGAPKTTEPRLAESAS